MGARDGTPRRKRVADAGIAPGRLLHASMGKACLADEPPPHRSLAHTVRFEAAGPCYAIMQWNSPFWHVFPLAAPGPGRVNAGDPKHAPNVPRCAARSKAASWTRDSRTAVPGGLSLECSAAPSIATRACARDAHGSYRRGVSGGATGPVTLQRRARTRPAAIRSACSTMPPCSEPPHRPPRPSDQQCPKLASPLRGSSAKPRWGGLGGPTSSSSSGSTAYTRSKVGDLFDPTNCRSGAAGALDLRANRHRQCQSR